MIASTISAKLVLIVDDIEDNRVLLERALKVNGYRTVSVNSGQQALAFMSRECPDIVLLDWMMPGLSGFETLKTIRETHNAAHLPVIMCTAIGEDENIVEALNAGANDYVTKPVSIPILRARMAAHLTQTQTVNDLDQEKTETKRRLHEQTRRLFAQQAKS